MALLAAERAYAHILYGAIGSDVAAQRPGQRAAVERSVRAPLQEAGLSKTEVRTLARFLGLANWDKPQNACLSSRVPLGSLVSAEKLNQVERAEAAVRALGFRQVRVRHQGRRGSVEVGMNELSRLQEDPVLRASALQAVCRAGFDEAAIDPMGYRSSGAEADPVV